MKKRYAKLAITLGIAAVCILAWAGGVTEILQSTQGITFFFTQYGGYALALYLILFVVLGATGVPPMLFMVPTRFIWNGPMAFAVSLCGGLGAALFGFWLSRHMGRDFLSRHIPKHLHRFDTRLRQNAFTTVIVLRLMFFLMPPVNWLLGLSRLRSGTFIAGTVIGALPGTIFFTFVGHTLVDWLLAKRFGPVVIIAAAAGGILLLWHLSRRSN